MSKLSDFMRKNGRLPGIKLVIRPLDSSRPGTIEVTNFISYSFNSSIFIPVDSFSFTFANPTSDKRFTDYVAEGDIAVLTTAEGGTSGGQNITTGIIDAIEVETTTEGEFVHIHGRDMMSQFEDQSAVSINDKPIYAARVTVAQAIDMLRGNTRIPGVKLQQAPAGAFLLATDPGESKLSALQRFIEPLNCLAWSDPSGNLVVGRPNQGQSSTGLIVLDRENRVANCASIKVSRSSTQIPNVVLPVWAGQENIDQRNLIEQRLLNKATGPSRLLKLKHFVQKTIVVSTPHGSDPQSLSDINMIKVGGANLLQAYAVREIARANIQELIVQAVVPGHFNDDMTPFAQDTCYDVYYPRGDVDEKLYCFQVEYSLSKEQGPRTSLYFCKLGRIVAGISVSAVEKKLVKKGLFS